MKEWTLKLCAVLIFASAAHAGKLDLDIYASRTATPRATPDGPEIPRYNWVPGDPHAERGSPKWVKHLSHAGYAGLGVAGLAGSIATGGVAPAIGFGLVALVQSYLEWREIKTPSE